MTMRAVRAGVALTLVATAFATSAPIAAAENPGSDTAQWDCVGFFRANASPGTPVAGGNRQDPGATQGGLHLGDFASQAHPCG